jgi:putative toxin-antitoxin system antitoxin component (TIGR02293 family)
MIYQTGNSTENLVSESLSVYLREQKLSDANYVSLPDFLNNKMLVINSIRLGLSYPLFNSIREFSSFTDTDWAYFLDVSEKTLQRYKKTGIHTFKPIHSEKILEIAEVVKSALDVFGSMNAVKLWLHTPSAALAGGKPMDFLKDSYGKELLLSELTRIDHGIFC